MFIRIVPWILGLITALWFGRMAKSAGRNWLGWALGGGFFALVVATIVLGVGQATSIPFSELDRTIGRIECTAVAVVVIGVLGWLCTTPLHRQHRAFWPQANKPAAPGSTSQPPPASGAGKPKTKGEPVKPSSSSPAPTAQQ
jgi:hypothetical protein